MRALAALLLAAAVAAPGAAAISNAAAKNLTRVLYIHNYPTMLFYKSMYNEVIAPGQPYKWNQFVVQDKLPDAKTGGANANVDFLTATAWIDTRDDPIVLTIPEQDNPDRYMSVQTTFIKGFETDYVGTRMAGKKDVSARYYIQSPATQLKTDPGGLFKTILYSDSDYSRVQARVGPITGPADVDKAKQLLAGFKVTPLSEFLEGQIGTKAIPPRKARTPDPKFYPWNDNLLKGDDLQFINFFNWALPFMKIHKGNESQFVADCADIGVKSGQFTDFSTFPADTLDAMKAGMKDAYTFIFDPANAAKFAGTDKLVDLNFDVLDFERHAVSSVIGENGVFTPTWWETESFAKDFPDAQPGDQYTLKFDAAKIPGVNKDGAGFWSVTAYSLPDRKLVPNVLGRYSIQSTSKNLKYNPDGSLEIYMQADAPGDGKQGNWLPTPAKGPFSYVLRVYGPGGNAKPMSEAKQPLQPENISPVAIRAANGGGAAAQATAPPAPAAGVAAPKAPAAPGAAAGVAAPKAPGAKRALRT